MNSILGAFLLSAAIEPESLRAALETVFFPSNGFIEIPVSKHAGGRLQRRAAIIHPNKSLLKLA
ncbi:hypothetical protein [Paenibacillus prosopidis]|uniref:hypothetical protein n=1 Tax=Paenibacillus prosopidis TaxID=630520 RepID=UPI000DF43477|nr:hypothetical protein [Paenibacillus prosopidis]